MGLDTLFDDILLPIAMTGGKCIFKLMLVSGAYILMRGNASESIKKVKSATIGYILLKTIQQYVQLIDSIVATIKF